MDILGHEVTVNPVRYLYAKLQSATAKILLFNTTEYAIL